MSELEGGGQIETFENNCLVYELISDTILKKKKKNN